MILPFFGPGKLCALHERCDIRNTRPPMGGATHELHRYDTPITASSVLDESRSVAKLVQLGDTRDEPALLFRHCPGLLRSGTASRDTNKRALRLEHGPCACESSGIRERARTQRIVSAHELEPWTPDYMQSWLLDCDPPKRAPVRTVAQRRNPPLLSIKSQNKFPGAC